MKYEVFKADGTKVSYRESIGQKVEGGKEWFLIGCDKLWRIWAYSEDDMTARPFTVDSTDNLFNLSIR